MNVFSDEEVVTAVEDSVNGEDPGFFISGLMALEHRRSKCINLPGYLLTRPRNLLGRKDIHSGI